MFSNILTSVIIVNFNGGQFLIQAVQAVLKTTVPVELFVIDNASQDGSVQLLRQNIAQDKRVTIVQNAQNVGFAKAANQALPMVQGNYLLFLNPDCLITAETLALFRQTMDCLPQFGMAGGLVRNLDGTEQSSCRRSVPNPWRSLVRVLHLNKFFPNYLNFQSFELTQKILPKQPIKIEGISGACMFVRRTALEQVGPMDESYFLHCEDLDWFIRFREHHWPILFIPNIEVTHVKGECSRRQPLKVLWYKHRSMIKFYRKFFRHRYPEPLMWGVFIAVWVRFSILALFRKF